MPNHVEETSEYLRYDFTKEELSAIASKMARDHQSAQKLEEEKKVVVAQFKSNIEALISQISEASRLLTNGYEHRNVDCLWMFNNPQDGIRTMVRKDTGEVVRTAKMSTEEMQETLPFGNRPLVEE